jgi:hypothetical protein
VVNFTGGTGHIETAELGLMTYQYITSNPNAVLFVYWTNDSYQQGEACGYDGQCGNFTQTNGNIYVGGGFSEYSQWGGAQYEVALQTEVYEGNVWLAYEGTWFGYFPGSNYSYLNQNSDQIEWGGQVNNSGTDDYPDATQMGSGAYPSGNDGYGFVAYQLHSQWLTFSYEYIDTAGSADTNYPGCYQEIPWTADGNLGSSMFLGGIAYPGCAN